MLIMPCHELDESIEHIISGHPILSGKEYLKEHDKALIYIRWHICKHYEIDVTDKWYNHKPNAFTEWKGCNDIMGYAHPYSIRYQSK